MSTFFNNPTQENVPVLWKIYCLFPAPNKTSSGVWNDTRSVTLIKPKMNSQNPLQVVSHCGVEVEDAIIRQLQPSYCYLSRAGSTLRVMFFNFSSAFHTIQPELVCQKL